MFRKAGGQERWGVRPLTNLGFWGKLAPRYRAALRKPNER